MARPVESYFLDTQTWLSIVLGDDKLPDYVRKSAEKAATKGRLYLPMICIWEIADFANTGILSLQQPIASWIDDALLASCVQLASFSKEVALESQLLPGDTSDLNDTEKIIIATARVNRGIVITTNPDIINYGDSLFVKVA